MRDKQIGRNEVVGAAEALEIQPAMTLQIGNTKIRIFPPPPMTEEEKQRKHKEIMRAVARCLQTMKQI